MKLASELYSRLSCVTLAFIAMTVSLVAGTNSSVDEKAIIATRQKSLTYGNGLDIPSGRQLPHQS
ncbi:MAG TPA: hypothetical protein VK905_04180 [Bacillota bacterium]|nr:hypothetical protein [Bacillota bacterium]